MTDGRHPALWGVGIVVGLLGALVLGAGPSPPARSAPPTPVVFVPGVTGTKLLDPRSGELVWGASVNLFRPRDGGYGLVLPLPRKGGESPSAAPAQAGYTPAGPILRLGLPGWTKMIYEPLRDRFLAAGYVLGDLASARREQTLFFFSYDWRRGNLEAVRRLDRQLEHLATTTGRQGVDLVCQSNAAKICRWLVKHGTRDVDRVAGGSRDERSYRIRRLVLIGASNDGALRAFQLLLRGRTYVPALGRRLLPETLFAIRPLFEDLPAHRRDLFFDERGKPLDVDLFDAASWERYGWSVFSREAAERLRRARRPDLFSDPETRRDYLERQLAHARRFADLLAQDAPGFSAPRYYRLENASAPTMARALLTRERDGWRTTFLGERRVDRSAHLAALAAEPGDGHATLTSQRALSPQEVASLAGTAVSTGGHFEALIQPEALDALLGFLDAPPRR